MVVAKQGSFRIAQYVCLSDSVCLRRRHNVVLAPTWFLLLCICREGDTYPIHVVLSQSVSCLGSIFAVLLRDNRFKSAASLHRCSYF